MPHVSLQRQTGFTLIEVMVALAILAVVAVAASRASSAYLNSVEVLRTSTLAHFVAQNVAADIRIQQTAVSANSTQTLNSQGREWQVVMSVSDTAIPTTPALKHVNISVAPIVDDQVRRAVTDIDILVADPAKQTGSLDLAATSNNGAPL